jgi:hypothetical protein
MLSMIMVVSSILRNTERPGAARWLGGVLDDSVTLSPTPPYQAAT